MRPDPLYEAAQAVAPYADDEQVRAGTQFCLDAGHRILQIHKLGKTDAEHVAALLALAELPQGAKVLDAGCGVGAVADLMAATRPDLTFVLQNVSQAQLDLCPPRFERICGDFHDIPVPDASFDAVLFLYSLGHAQLETALAEVARVLKPGGILFIYDIAAADPTSVVGALGYVPHSVGRVLAAAEQFHHERVRTPRTDVSGFFDIMDAGTYASVFDGVQPVAYRMVRR